jgi:hypothetical protein
MVFLKKPDQALLNELEREKEVELEDEAIQEQFASLNAQIQVEAKLARLPKQSTAGFDLVALYALLQSCKKARMTKLLELHGDSDNFDF